jgi:hypothetical protein
MDPVSSNRPPKTANRANARGTRSGVLPACSSLTGGFNRPARHARVGGAPGAIILSPIYINPNGQVDFFLPSEAERSSLIQASTNLVDWTTLATKVANDVVLSYGDNSATNFPYRFYRAIPAP